MFQMIKKITLLFLLTFLVCSCTNSMQNSGSKNSNINSVSYSKTVGRAGFLKIIATKDSLISTKFGNPFNDIPNSKQKIKTEDWKKIVSSIDLEMVKKTKSGEERGSYDGPDEIFEITTTDQNYKLLNVSDSSQYKQLGNLRNIIKKITASPK